MQEQSSRFAVGVLGVCEWLGAHHLRSGVRVTLVERGVDTSEEGLIRGAGPIGLGFPQRGLGETGKSPITMAQAWA